MLPRAKELLETRREAWTRPSLTAAEGTHPDDALTLNFWPSDCETMHFCRLSHPVCGTLLQQPLQPNTITLIEIHSRSLRQATWTKISLVLPHSTSIREKIRGGGDLKTRTKFSWAVYSEISLPRWHPSDILLCCFLLRGCNISHTCLFYIIIILIKSIATPAGCSQGQNHTSNNSEV